MKKVMIVILILAGAYIFKVPEYRELNELAIIEAVAVDYDGYNYTLYLKEVIPVKGDQDIEYEYKYYKGEAESIEESYKEIVTNTKKKLYLKRCKFLVTNLYTSEQIIDNLDIEPQTIYHEIDDVYAKLEDL